MSNMNQTMGGQTQNKSFSDNVENEIGHKSGNTKPKVEYDEIDECPKEIFRVERVIDWKKRIEGYTQYQQNKYEEAFKRLKMFESALDDTEGWDVKLNNKSTGLFVENKISVRGINTLRVKCPIDLDPLTAWRAITNSTNRMKYDKNV